MLESIELFDLGDAKEETKQRAQIPFMPDSWYGWGYPAY